MSLLRCMNLVCMHVCVNLPRGLFTLRVTEEDDSGHVHLWRPFEVHQVYAQVKTLSGKNPNKKKDE